MRQTHGQLQTSERQSTKVHWAINVSLAFLCAVSYAFLITLYLSGGMNVASLTYIDYGTISPTTLVPIFVIILTGATSALLTRSVEHDLWYSLLNQSSSRHEDRNAIESLRKAQWTVSPLGRLLYAFNGHSWVLRFGGLLLFGSALLNPILLYGVRPHPVTHSSTELASEPWMQGFMPLRNRGFQQDVDILFLAAQASSENLLHMRPPPADICSDNWCNATANATALQANCVASSRLMIDEDELRDHLVAESGTVLEGLLGNSPSTKPIYGTTYCNALSNHTCVTLTSTNDYNFTSGFSNDCFEAFQSRGESADRECPPNDFALITGAWITSGRDYNNKFHQVDCSIQFGYVEMTQFGDASPNFERNSFTPSTERLHRPRLDPFKSSGSYDPSDGDRSWDLQLGYLRGNSPWNFAYSEVFNTSDSGAQSIVPYVLASSEGFDNILGQRFLEDDERKVADTIQASFQMATRLAFSRAPRSAFLTVSWDGGNRWSYDPRVLFVLAVPLLATILVLSAYCDVHGDDVVVGYDPIKIARRADQLLATVTGIDHGSHDVLEGKASPTEVDTIALGIRQRHSLDGEARNGQDDGAMPLVMFPVDFSGYYSQDMERSGASLAGRSSSSKPGLLEQSNS